MYFIKVQKPATIYKYRVKCSQTPKRVVQIFIQHTQFAILQVSRLWKTFMNSKYFACLGVKVQLDPKSEYLLQIKYLQWKYAHKFAVHFFKANSNQVTAAQMCKLTFPN